MLPASDKVRECFWINNVVSAYVIGHRHATIMLRLMLRRMFIFVALALFRRTIFTRSSLSIHRDLSNLKRKGFMLAQRRRKHESMDLKIALWCRHIESIVSSLIFYSHRFEDHSEY